MRYIFAFFLAMAISSTLAQLGQQSIAPIVDGNCNEYAQVILEPINLDDSVFLYIYQDDHYVWMCYSYPKGSIGSMDMRIQTNRLSPIINLHVSGQLGEWPADSLNMIPNASDSPLWWNHKDWIANEIWINGLDTSGDSPRYKFKNAKSRELQIAKHKFGHNIWRINLEIRGIKDSTGVFFNKYFPKKEEYYELTVN